MQLFTLKLPRTGNDGRDYAPALLSFEQAALDIAGGCTLGASQQGSWRAPNGAVYRDRVVPFEIACSLDDFRRLVDRAFALFPDQEALFVTSGSEARSIERKDIVSNDNITPLTEAQAYAAADRLRAYVGRLQEASWSLDEALRLVRLTKAKGADPADALGRLRQGVADILPLLPEEEPAQVAQLPAA